MYDEAYKKRMMYLGGVASLGIVCVIFLIKVLAYWLTGSLAVLGALFDAGLDSLMAVANLLAIRYALLPPDANHRFGHGKIESIASAGQGVFIFISSGYLLWGSIDRLIHPIPLRYMHVALAIASISIVLSFSLILIQSYVIKVTQSVIIRADSLHYKGDLVINGSVIASAVAAGGFGVVWVDAALGLFVALFLAIGALRIIRSALHQLLDRELTDDHAVIERIILSHPKVLGFHDLRTRQSSLRKFMQFHLDLDADMVLREAHKVAQEVERSLLDVFPDAEIIIHQDPLGYDTHDELRQG